MKEYIADFETLACDKEKTHVHTWGVMNQKTKKKSYGSSIAQFITWCKRKSTEEKTIVWFHNLKFDGVFAMDYLERALKMKYHANGKSFSYNALIDDMGNYYSIEIVFKRYKSKKERILIYDSAKRIPNMSVKDMAIKYHLPMKKGEYDYMKYRPEGHVMTPEEKEYLDNDLEIVGAVLDIQKSMGLENMTIGSCALAIYKDMIGEGKFKRNFPQLDKYQDDFIRLSYSGGFTYVNKNVKNKLIGTGMVFDVNSLYPFVMASCLLPYGMPVSFEGRYEPDENYPLYIQQFKAKFKLKKNHIPTIQLDLPHTLKKMKYPEYATKSDGTDLITCTNVDLEMLFEHYDVEMATIEWLGGYKFRGSTKLFTSYVKHFNDLKVHATNNKLYGIRETCKLLLNSLYGKFGSKMERKNKPVILENDRIAYAEIVTVIKPPIYTAIASFVTAYGRAYTQKASQQEYHRYLYSDTDSVHLSGSHFPNYDIHQADLGKWKYEGTFQKAKYVRQKAYVHEFQIVHPWVGIIKKYKVACSGMTDEIKKQVNFKNFYVGRKFEGKKTKKIVTGGVVLVERPFTI